MLSSMPLDNKYILNGVPACKPKLVSWSERVEVFLASSMALFFRTHAKACTKPCISHFSPGQSQMCSTQGRYPQTKSYHSKKEGEKVGDN